MKRVIFIYLLLGVKMVVFSQIKLINSQQIEGRFPQKSEFLDVNGDSKLDLIIVYNNASGINDLNANQVWLNDGNGNYTFHFDFGNSPSYNFDFGDLDQDGDIDIFVVNLNLEGGLSTANKVWLNDGNGNFTENGQFLGLKHSSSVVLGDFDNDNDLDAFVGNSGNNNRENIVWFNDGNGQFTEGTQNIGYNRTLDLVAIDIDNDGDQDVISANFKYDADPQSSANIIWFNNGNGVFSEGQNIGNSNSYDVSIGDLDGDCLPDLVFSNIKSVNIFLNNESGNFSFYKALTNNTNPSRKYTELSDFDLDGDLDIILCITSDTEQTKIFSNNCHADFSEEFILGISNAVDVSVGDINGDNLEDVFILNTNFQEGQFWTNESEVIVSNHEIYGENSCFNEVTSFSISGDICSVLWNFDDPDSGTENTSTLIDPSHIFSKPGTFIVSAQFTCNLTDKLFYEVVIADAPEITDLDIIYSCESVAGSGISNNFDTSNIEGLLNEEGDDNIQINYFNENGIELSSPLPNPYTNSTPFTEYITARVTNLNFQCFRETTLVFKTISSPEISHINYDNFENSIEVLTVSDGNYEYSIDGVNFQDENTFYNLTGGIINVVLNSKDGCGTDEQQLVLIDYPKFFTPNFDGYNDYWHILGAENYPDSKVFIFDRFGKLIIDLKSNDPGWDGNYNGTKMAGSDYWFTVNLGNGRSFKGHFTLKR